MTANQLPSEVRNHPGFALSVKKTILPDQGQAKKQETIARLLNKNIYIIFTLGALFLGTGIPGELALSTGPGVTPDPIENIDPYPYNPVIKNLTYSMVGNKVKLNWDLSLPGEWIGIFKGKTPIALLPGYYQEFEYEVE
ncbi:MAG: hypothetical protein ABIK28_25740, partial [Planctomycetota bacterium]